MKNILVICVLAAAGLWGCKKSSSKPATPTWTPGSDIYFVGQDTGQVAYWKNGVRTVLGAGEGNGIAVNGSSVYVGGVADRSVGSTTTFLAAYWKDGVEQDLTDTGIAYADQPVVAGGDVYVPGYYFGAPGHVNAAYWKNGQRVNLDSGSWGYASGMAVSGTDVYAIGTVSQDTSLVWKNGQRLTSSYFLGGSEFSQIIVSGGNVYLSGYVGYEVNFSGFMQMPGASMFGTTTSIFINGSDVYVAGGRDSASNGWATYWKNGAAVPLPNYPGTTSSVATGVVVAGSDVYVAGIDWVNGQYWGVYWKNGVEEILTKNGSVNGVVAGN